MIFVAILIVIGLVKKQPRRYWLHCVVAVGMQAVAGWLFYASGTLDDPFSDGIITAAARRASNDGPRVLVVFPFAMLLGWVVPIWLARRGYVRRLADASPRAGNRPLRPWSNFFERRRKRRAKKGKLEAAYNLGRAAGDAMVEAVTGFLNASFAELRETRERSLRERLVVRMDQHPAEHPRHVGLRVYEEFCASCNELAGVIRSKAEATLSDWFSLADQMQMRPQLNDMVDHRIEQWVADLKLRGFAVVNDVVSERSTPS